LAAIEARALQAEADARLQQAIAARYVDPSNAEQLAAAKTLAANPQAFEAYLKASRPLPQPGLLERAFQRTAPDTAVSPSLSRIRALQGRA
jgi:hypothetical protein